MVATVAGTAALAFLPANGSQASHVPTPDLAQCRGDVAFLGPRSGPMDGDQARYLAVRVPDKNHLVWTVRRLAMDVRASADRGGCLQRLLDLFLGIADPASGDARRDEGERPQRVAGGRRPVIAALRLMMR